MHKSGKSDIAGVRKLDNRPRVLARTLAEDLRRRIRVGSGGRKWVTMDTVTETDLGERFDFTYRGGDGDSY